MVAVALVHLIIIAGCRGRPLPERPRVGPIEHVIHISVDGLHYNAITTLGPELAPNFTRLCNGKKKIRDA